MGEDNCNEKDFRILDQIAGNPAISQRALARDTGISLGLTNLTLKKFLKTGYVQVTRLDKRKLEYLLTPKGFLAMTQRTYRYVSRTITEYQRLKGQLVCLLQGLQQQGYESFLIHGDGEIKTMIESLAPSIFAGTPAEFLEHRGNDNSAVILNVSAGPVPAALPGNVVNVFEAMG